MHLRRKKRPPLASVPALFEDALLFRKRSARAQLPRQGQPSPGSPFSRAAGGGPKALFPLSGRVLSASASETMIKGYSSLRLFQGFGRGGRKMRRRLAEDSEEGAPAGLAAEALRVSLPLRPKLSPAAEKTGAPIRLRRVKISSVCPLFFFKSMLHIAAKNWLALSEAALGAFPASMLRSPPPPRRRKRFCGGGERKRLLYPGLAGGSRLIFLDRAFRFVLYCLIA